GSTVMLKFITGNPLLFLLVWLLIYALLLFTLSAIGEWRRYHNRRQSPPKEPDRGLSIQLPPQISGRRIWPRREGNPTPVLIAQPTGPYWLPLACVVSPSQGCRRRPRPRPLNTSQQLRVCTRLAPKNVPWAEVEVRTC